ncbi:hypothetical protein AAZX31_03G204700 [Glycine max]
MTEIQVSLFEAIRIPSSSFASDEKDPERKERVKKKKKRRRRRRRRRNSNDFEDGTGDELVKA